MANTKIINLLSGKQFLKELKAVIDVVIYAESTEQYFKTTKGEVLRMAEGCKIQYLLIDTVYKDRRVVMAIY